MNFPWTKPAPKRRTRGVERSRTRSRASAAPASGAARPARVRRAPRAAPLRRHRPLPRSPRRSTSPSSSTSAGTGAGSAAGSSAVSPTASARSPTWFRSRSRRWGAALIARPSIEAPSALNAGGDPRPRGAAARVRRPDRRARPRAAAPPRLLRAEVHDRARRRRSARASTGPRPRSSSASVPTSSCS